MAFVKDSSNSPNESEDNPSGFEEKVTMLKAETGALCRFCFYIKRGSLGNMRLSELATNLETNESFSDKSRSSMLLLVRGFRLVTFDMTSVTSVIKGCRAWP